jgi:ACS family hexuronate transporter-like MFS transporter
MMLVSLISYIDRNTLALLAPTILDETRMSAEQFGWIVSAFSIAYMIGNPLWGRLLDRFGLRGGMATAVSFWTLASVSHAFARGFGSFAIARAALGFGEGATFPGGLRAALQTLPAHLQSRGIALAYSGGSLGAIITPIIITPIAREWGWRSAFWFTGLVGLVWLVIWSIVSRRDDIRAHRPATALDAPSAKGPAIGDPRIWSFMAAYALGALPLGFILYDASIYLNRALGASQEQIGHALWIPPLGWEIGYFVWGWLCDRTVRGTSRIAAYRRLLAAATLMSLPLALTPQLPSFWLVMAELFFAMFVTAGFVMVPVSYATYVYSSAHAGLIAGFGAGSWSAVVALVMPVFGRLFDGRLWTPAFVLAALFPVAGYVIWSALNWRESAATSRQAA